MSAPRETAPDHRRGLGDRWLAGTDVPGVTFALNDAVEIVAGSRAGAIGSVILLLGVDPEPSYLVELATGAGDARVRQSALRHVA